MADPRSTVLVIDDDADMCWAVRNVLAQGGLAVAEASNGRSGLEIAARSTPDAVLLDMRMPGLGGKEVLRLFQRLDAALPVIILTAHGTIADAVEAVRTGAFDYLTKPFRNEQLLAAVRRALARRRPAHPGLGSTVRSAVTALMGHGPAIQGLIGQIEAVAGSDYSVLVLGETGSGKEIVARTLHQHGRRAARPFVIVDCGTVLEQLSGSELFGHEKGAYTGATARQLGWFEMAADGGTLFLDEIGNLCAGAQQALLRALD
jgi:DNA-binding NtrC family response regulator